MIRKEHSPVSRKGSLRYAAETEIAIAQKASSTPPSITDRDHIIHELRVHQVELEMQNDQLQRMQLALEESRDRYIDLYEFAPLAYLTLNHQSQIVEANLTAAILLEKDRKRLLNRRFERFIAREDRERWHHFFADIMLQKSDIENFDLSLPRSDGSHRFIRLHGLRMSQQNTLSLRIALIDVTEKKEAETKILRLANYDTLTGLPNRRLLQDRLEHSLATASRNSFVGAILFLDLDNFKALNDTQGHDAGDLLLMEAAQRLHACVRAIDTVARLGGDEFVILMDNIGSNEHDAAIHAKEISEKIRVALLQPYLLKDGSFHCTASIGIALFHGTETVKELLKYADMAMYHAKNCGRDTLCFFNPNMQAEMTTRNELITDLRQALSSAQFRLFYQPQFNSAGNITSAESLIRWAHPEHGIMLPCTFISLAEETGLILPIGQWVLLTACRQLKIWEATPYTKHLRLTVNISTQEFRQSDFVDNVLHILNETGADPTRLKIELTESQLVHDIHDTVQKMAALKMLGIGFSIDDFGTGYSSLSYLAQLPFDEIKIDRSFVHNLDPSGLIMVKTIIKMASCLGMNVIAEGVETEAQRAFLDGNDCHIFQGNLLSEPLSADDFDQYFRRCKPRQYVNPPTKSWARKIRSLIKNIH